MKHMIEEMYVQQAKEMVSSEGHCPKNTICSSCLISQIYGVSGCNPEKAKNASKIFLKMSHIKIKGIK